MLKKGISIVILMIAVSIMAIILLSIYPLWSTAMKREREKELIFRGSQYVEAIRIYQIKNPGKFPSSLDELLKQKCIRKLYKDPTNNSSGWDLIVIPSKIEVSKQALRSLLIISNKYLKYYRDVPQIIGVVSSNPEKSIKIYDKAEHYNKWFFYYGKKQDETVKMEYFKPEKAGENEK
ncbi:MAG: hypothetical protein AB1410_02345 [Acidobacteriota bacterium]